MIRERETENFVQVDKNRTHPTAVENGNIFGWLPDMVNKDEYNYTSNMTGRHRGPKRKLRAG